MSDFNRGVWLLTFDHGRHVSMVQEDSVEIAEAHAWNWPAERVPVAVLKDGEVVRYREGFPGERILCRQWRDPSPAEVLVTLALVQCVAQGDGRIGGVLDVPQLREAA